MSGPKGSVDTGDDESLAGLNFCSDDDGEQASDATMHFHDDSQGVAPAAVGDPTSPATFVGTDLSVIPEATWRAILQDKSCVACLISALTPSPLCSGSFRLGDYPDWSSNWCKHCAACARVTLVPKHGALAAVAEWLKASVDNRVWFLKRVVAYYSLKAEGSVQRVSNQMIDARVVLLEKLDAWSKRHAGVPPVLGMGPRVIVDLREAEALLGNPLLMGGRVCELRVNNATALGVSLGAEHLVASRASLPFIVPQSSHAAFDASPAGSVLSNADIRCETPAYTQAFAAMLKEYAELAHARMSGSLASWGTEDRPTSFTESTEWQLALVGTPAAQHVPDDVDARSTDPPSGKKRKVANSLQVLKAEAAEKIKHLQHDDWKTTTCDKAMDGMITRLGNARSKLLDDCDVGGAAEILSVSQALVAIHDFGTVFKRGFGKSGKDASLSDLVRPLATLRDITQVDPTTWHPTLRVVTLQVDFQNSVAEGDVKKALSLMSVTTISSSCFAHLDDPSAQKTHAIEFVVTHIERFVINEMKKLRAGKKDFGLTSMDFHTFINSIQGQLCPISQDAIDIISDDGLRNRASRLMDQLESLAVCSAALQAEIRPDGGIAKPWPSLVKKSLAMILDTPSTNIAKAMDAWAGSRLMMVKVQSSVQRSTHDEHTLSVVTEVSAETSKCIFDPACSVEAFNDQLGKFNKLVLSLSDAIRKISPHCYEECSAHLHSMMQKLVEFAGHADGVLWRRVRQDVVVPMRAICHDAPLDPDAEGIAPRFEGSAAVTSLQRAMTLLSSALPPWEAFMENFSKALGNFLINVVKPSAKDTFAEFEAQVVVLRSIAAKLGKGSRLRGHVVSGLTALATILTSPDREKPIQDLLSTWLVWKSSGPSDTKDRPMIELLLELGRTRQALSPPETFTDDDVRSLVCMLAEGPATNALLTKYIFKNLSAAIVELESLVPASLFGETESSTWDPMQEDAPSMAGFVGGTEDERSEFLRSCVGGYDWTSDPTAVHNLKFNSTLALIASLTETFDTCTVEIDSLNNAQPIKSSVCLAHLRLRCQSATCICLALLIRSQTVSSTVPPAIVSVSKGGKFKTNDALVKLLAAFHNHVEILRATMASATYRDHDVASIPATVAILRIRNWANMLDKYMISVKTYVARQFLKHVDQQVHRLKEMCPQWSSWASDTAYDAEEFGKFVDNLQHEKVKASLVVVHAGISDASQLMRDIDLANPKQDDKISGMMAAGKNAIAYAKQLLAMRACGRLILGKAAADKESIKVVRTSMKSLGTTVPAAIQSAFDKLG
jgi:hypothetical protein